MDRASTAIAEIFEQLGLTGKGRTEPGPSAGRRPPTQMETARGKRALEEAVLYVATAVALVAVMAVLGVGTGSAMIGVVGAMLVTTGTFIGWRTRRWARSAALAIGIAAGVGAGAGLQLVIQQETASLFAMVYLARADPNLQLALRMSFLPVLLSFMATRPESAAFSLVPGVAIFGLVGGRSVEPLITVCFVAFLSAGLVVLCYGMLLSTPTFRGLRWWRGRHWLSLGGLIAAVLFLAYVLFLPVSAYLTQYRWPAMMAAFGTTTGMPLTYRSEARQARSYQVGRGPIALTEIPIFSFVGEPAEFWRGQAFDVYVGNGWVTSELEEPGILPKGNTLDLTGAREFRARPWARVLTHEVRAEEALPFILYSPGQMQRVVARPPIRLSQVHGLQVDAYGCAAAPRSRMPRGATYRVVSAPLELSVVRLRGVGNSDAGGTGGDPSESGGPPPISLASSYLSVPVGARRVADAALQLVGQEPSPAHKLLALVAYLQQQCVYTMSAPAIPPGRDAADYFLFQQKRGYCDLFATTLALMGRAVGVPTRLVTGYAYPGPPVPGEAGEEPERTYVREVDGHAWVEAYVLPWGWISVDATPAGASAPMPALRRFWLGLRFFWEDHPLTVGILALAVLSVVAFGVLRLRGALWREHGSADRGHLDSAARGIVLRTYADLSRLFRRLGHPRLATQTPLEYLASLEDLGRDDQVGGKDGRARRRAMIASVLAGARALTQLFLLARYAPDPVSEESAVRAQDTLRNIRRELRTRRR